MKVEVGKRHILLIVAVLLAWFGVFAVYAYNSNPAVPSNFGHTINEVDGISCGTGQAVTRNATGWSCINVGICTTGSRKWYVSPSTFLGDEGSVAASCGGAGPAMCSSDDNVVCPAGYVQVGFDDAVTGKAAALCQAACPGSAGGITSCPSGMTLVSGSAGHSSFCIDSVRNAASNFKAAHTACVGKSARVCDSKQWIDACEAGVPGGTTSGGIKDGTDEWVYDLGGWWGVNPWQPISTTLRYGTSRADNDWTTGTPSCLGFGVGYVGDGPNGLTASKGYRCCIGE